tara:strand:+ start:52 stop:591 length:540 start_codon:yes stop_codon:yes gene_type:complete
MSNLRLLDEQSISSSVSAFSVYDVFTSDYDVYQITATDLSTTGTTATEVWLRFVSKGGSVISTSNYEYGGRYFLAWTGGIDLNGENATGVRRCFAEVTDQSPEVASSTIWVFNPYSDTEYTSLLFENSNYYSGTYASQMKGFAHLKKLERVTGFHAYENNSSRPLASGTFRTYGLRVDS